MTDRADDDLNLPSLEADEDGEGVTDQSFTALQLAVFDDEGDAFDDAYADDLPLDIRIETDHVEPSVIGDDAVGMQAPAMEEGLAFAESAVSLIDEGRGHAEEGLDEHGDEELGIDPIPREIDDGGMEGLADPTGDRVDTDEFPPLDGEEDDDDDEIDVGIEIAPPPTEPLE